MFLSLKTAVIKTERERREQGVRESQHRQRGRAAPPAPDLTGHVDGHFLAPPVPDVPGRCAEQTTSVLSGLPKPQTEEEIQIRRRYVGRLLPPDESPRKPYRKITEGSCSSPGGLLPEGATLSAVSPLPGSGDSTTKLKC